MNNSDENVNDRGHASSSDTYDSWVLTGWYGWIVWIIRQFDIRLYRNRWRLYIFTLFTFGKLVTCSSLYCHV
jgi:hypothetical protein